MKKAILLLLLTNIIFSSYLYVTIRKDEMARDDFSNKILKVRGIVVVDTLGVERAILAAHLPEAQRNGGRLYSGRSQTGVSGLMLYDSEGLERGGYVTDDEYGNIFLTLDSKSNQTAMFLAEPQGATTMRMWSRTGNKVDFLVDDHELKVDMVKKGKKLNIVNND